MRKYARTGKFFNQKDLANSLNLKLKLGDFFKIEGIAKTIIDSMLQFKEIKNSSFIQKKPNKNNILYRVNNHYLTFITGMKNSFYDLFVNQANKGKDTEDGITLYSFRNFSQRENKNTKFDQELIALGIMEASGLINFEVKSSNNPQIYIRINSIYPLEREVRKGKNYSNKLLNSVLYRHRLSVAMLTYLFKMKVDGNSRKERIKNYTKKFWEIIEDYFLGNIPEGVSSAISQK